MHKHALTCALLLAWAPSGTFAVTPEQPLGDLPKVARADEWVMQGGNVELRFNVDRLSAQGVEVVPDPGFTRSVTLGMQEAGGPASYTIDLMVPNTFDPVTNTLSVVSGSGQSAVVSTAFAAPVRAHVAGAGKTPLAGVAVNFTAPDAGASATLSAASCVNAANGEYQVTATANATAGGPCNVVASSSGLTSVNFALTNTAVAATPPTITYAPGTGTTITYSGAGAGAAIVATHSGGAGSGAAATTTVGACLITGGGAAFPTANVAKLSFVGNTVAAQNIVLPACVPQAAQVDAALTCPETAGAGAAVIRVWTLRCPAAAVVNVPPTIDYVPTINSTTIVSERAPTTISIGCPIDAPPCEGAGGGLAATSRLENVIAVYNGPMFSPTPMMFCEFVRETGAPAGVSTLNFVAQTADPGDIRCTCPANTTGLPGEAFIARVNERIPASSAAITAIRDFNIVCGDAGVSIAYNPPAGASAGAGGPVLFTGVTTIGTVGNGQILATPSGGATSGTTTLTAFTLSGTNAADFTLTSAATLTFTAGVAAPQNMTLTCVSGATARTANLRATETVGGDPSSQRYWVLDCPAGAPIPPRFPPIVADLMLTAGDGAAFDGFGAPLAADGDTLVVGVPVDDANGLPNCGSVYVYVKVGDAWIQQIRLNAADAAANDRFGASVAIEGDLLVAGAIWDDVNGDVDAGSAYIFQRIGNVWTQQAKIVPNPGDGSANDYFGYSISVSQGLVVVGAPIDTIGANGAQGSAYVFMRQGQNWIQSAKLFENNGNVSDYFGQSVLVMDGTVFVGAVLANRNGISDSGKVNFYRLMNGFWTLSGELQPTDPAANQQFGQSISGSQGTILVGTPGDNEFRGAAYVFVPSGNSWDQRQKLVFPSAVSDDRFGSAVAIKGQQVIVGAPFYNPNDVPGMGAAVMFRLVGALYIVDTVAAFSDGQSQDLAGAAVAIVEGDFVIGVSLDDVGPRVDQGTVGIVMRTTFFASGFE